MGVLKNYDNFFIGKIQTYLQGYNLRYLRYIKISVIQQNFMDLSKYLVNVRPTLIIIVVIYGNLLFLFQTMFVCFLKSIEIVKLLI